MVLSYPSLSRGTSPDSGGTSEYLVTVVGFTAAVLAIVSAYGIWGNMKWGKILAILVDAVCGLVLLGAIVFASTPVKITAAVILVVPILIIVLLLSRSTTPSAA